MKRTEEGLKDKLVSPVLKDDTLKRYSAISSKINSNCIKKPNLDNPTSDVKRVHYEEQSKEEETNLAFLPSQTMGDTNKPTKFNVNYAERSDLNEHLESKRGKFQSTEDEYTKSQSYYLDDQTLYFTNGPFYKDEMHKRVERHHQGNSSF